MKTYFNLKSIQEDLELGHINLPNLIDYYLGNIDKKANLNIFLEVFAEEARAKAKAIQLKIETKSAGKLAGMVLGLKDNIAYKGHKFSASSKILENFTSLYSATVVERLIAEDCIIIGRLNCDEFAMGSSNEKSAYGKVLNPVNIEHVPGGSSGGSAAAVAADLCLATLGTDTGGSIRQPASFCGTVGLKPTYGRVSRWGAIAFASSFDQIGPITKSIDDAAIILETISGSDAYDSTASKVPITSYSPNNSSKTIGVLKELADGNGIDSEVFNAYLKSIDQLKASGHQVKEISFPYITYSIPTYYVLTTAEASSNLSRYTGVLYGKRAQEVTDLESTYKKSRSEGFGKEVKRRIMLGTFVLSEGYYDAYYGKAQKVRRLIQEKTIQLFEEVDAILLPTTPSTAFKFGEKSADPVTMYLEDIFTVWANIAGIPGISVPVGNNEKGLPIGMQLLSNRFNENLLFDIGRTLHNK